MRCCPKCRNVPNERGIPWDEREIKEESYLEFRTQPMIEAALREARQEAAQEAPQPERTEQQDAACGMLPACAPLANPFVPFQRDDPPVYAAAVGAVRGTLFPGLDLPLRGQENSGELSGTLQRDLPGAGLRRGGAWRIPRHASRRCQSGGAVPAPILGFMRRRQPPGRPRTAPSSSAAPWASPVMTGCAARGRGSTLQTTGRADDVCL